MNKKTLLLLIAYISCVSTVFAQTSSKKSNGFFGNVLDKMTQVFANEPQSFEGKWLYMRPACVFETENLLKKAGGAVVATQVESKFKDYFKKMGVTEGKSNFTFKNDSTYSASLGLAKFSGKYSINAKTKDLTMTYALGIGKLHAKTVKSGNNLKILFDADGFLKLMKFLSTFTKDNSIEILAAMDDLYDGMLLGVDLKKETASTK